MNHKFAKRIFLDDDSIVVLEPANDRSHLMALTEKHAAALPKHIRAYLQEQIKNASSRDERAAALRLASELATNMAS